MRLRTSAALVAAVLACGPAMAQERHHPPQDMALHNSFYKNWMRPDKPQASCCSNSDCYPTRAKRDGGVWLARRREDGKWLSVPPEKVEHNRDSPDGRSHLCAPVPALEYTYENGVICFVPGAGT